MDFRVTYNFTLATICFLQVHLTKHCPDPVEALVVALQRE